MHARFSVTLLALVLTATLSSSAAAAIVQYQFTGDMLGQFIPVSSDAAADLFGVPRNSLSTVSADIKIVVDTANLPFIETDTSLGQEVLYQDAIVSSVIDINGVLFQTTRRPTAGTQQNEIEVTNTVNSAGLDALVIKSQNGLSNLWTTRTVPFNQTVGGVLLEDAVVTIANLQVVLFGAGTGWLDGFALPVATEDFDGTTSRATNIQFGIDLGPGLSQGFLQLTGTEASITVGPAAVPEPSMGLLLVAALGGMIAVSRRASERAVR